MMSKQIRSLKNIMNKDMNWKMYETLINTTEMVQA